MKLFVTVTLSACLILLTGCAGIARSHSAGDKTFTDVRSAKLGTESIGKVEYGEAKNIRVSSDSPSINSDSLKGRFEVVSVHGEKGQPFSITVAGVCDCLGFRKWSVVPISFLLDASGNTVAVGKFATTFAQGLNGVFPETGEFYVMLVADSESEGKTVGELRTGLSLPGGYVPGFSMSMDSHPTGIVQVNFPKIK